MKTNSSSVLCDLLLTSVDEIIHELDSIDNETLLKLIDNETDDTDTISIQSILTHIIFSGNKYVNYINKHIGLPQNKIKKELFNSTNSYLIKMSNLQDNIKKLFTQLNDELLEEIIEVKKIKTDWNQTYDIEQLIEHAIVHNQRHLNQIRRYKSLALKTSTFKSP